MNKKLFYCLIFLTAFFMFGANVNAAYISDGIYTIQSAIADKVVDVDNAGTKNGTNVQLFVSNNTTAQKWKVTEMSDGYYEITSMLDDNMVLDVDNAGTKNGTNVQIFKRNNTNAQRWTIRYADDGYYYIISKCGGLYLDVDNAGSANGTNIQTFKGNNTKAQKFKFIEVIEGTQTIEDGLYKIASSLDTQKTINITNSNAASGTATELRDISDELSNIWRIKYLNNGYYSIISYLDESKVLDVYNASGSNGNKVQIFFSNNTNAQKWIIKDLGDGYYSIISDVDHKYLDVYNAETKNGTKIQIYQGNSTNAQKFQFIQVEEEIIPDGYYTLNSSLDESKVVSVSGEIPQNGINVSLRTDNNYNSQKWYVKYLGEGIYSLTSGLSDVMVMDVYNNEKTNGTNVWLFASNNSDAQKWYIKSAGDGYYYIIAKNSGLYLDVYNAETVEGTNIQIFTGNKTNAQKFKLNPTTLNENDTITQNYEEGYYVFHSKLDNNKVIDVDNRGKTDGTNVQLFQSNDSLAQIWHLNKLNDGYYSITSSMTPEMALTANNRNAELATYTGADNQQWIIRDLGDGYVYIISKASGLTINVAGGSVANKTNIELTENTVSDSQMFKLSLYTDTKIYNGIDVSYYQKTVDWASVASSGIDFVIIRAGYGGDWTNQDDIKFLEYVAACEKYNIPYGLYLYSYASEIDNSNTSAQAEARHMLRLIDEIEKNNYSPNLGTNVFIDMEHGGVISAGKDKLTDVSDTFCSIIESNGYSCGVYANRDWLTNHLNASELAQKYVIWLAEYLPVVSPTYAYAKTQTPIYNLTPIKYWQFASDGKVNGVNGNVDVDLGYDIFD